MLPRILTLLLDATHGQKAQGFFKPSATRAAAAARFQSATEAI
jgi:hypothetical protein